MTIQQTFSSEVPALLQRHFDALHADSGIAVDVIRERGYQSALGKKKLAEAGFGKSQQRAPGLLIPVHTPDGSGDLVCYRPDYPRELRRKVVKYELPSKATARLDVPPRCREGIKDPAIPLWVTEGQKKADALATHGLCSMALLGVWNFKGRNEWGGVTLLADFDYIALKDRVVNIVYDSDVMTKKQVAASLERFTEHLQRKGAIVNKVYLPAGPEGEKVGVDDYLLHHDVSDLEDLVKAPPPQTRPAEPVVELLDDAPSSLNRPLALIDGNAYVTTWVWVSTTTRELEKDGEVVRLETPRVEKSKVMQVLDKGGVAYGPGGRTLEDLGLSVGMNDPPQDEKLWGGTGIKRYRQGRRPSPADVFSRVASVFDYFIDFGRSYGDQSDMCELSACFSMETWFAPAFTVLSYPWPSGGPGSGKTQWGNCWADTSYLGVVTTGGGSFAALRDLADYGATILFDDAEGIADPRKTDPDKRALILAGNRRGTTIPVKEPGPGGKGWVVRWVAAYCPRGFTSIELPDPILGSRSIPIPLVRTADRKRANRDPADWSRWPCDWRELQDDLWATALTLLPSAATVWSELDDEEEFIGREFEPWRPLVAVARLFERNGVDGLEARIRNVMRAYMDEKQDTDTSNRELQTVRAVLSQVLESNGLSLDTLDGLDGLDRLLMDSGEIVFNATDIAAKIKAAGAREAFDTEWVSPSTVGKQFRSLRFEKVRAPNVKRTRQWKVRGDALSALCLAYGVIRADSVTVVEDDDDDTAVVPVHPGQPVQPVQASLLPVDDDDVGEV